MEMDMVVRPVDVEKSPDPRGTTSQRIGRVGSVFQGGLGAESLDQIMERFPGQTNQPVKGGQ